MTSQSKEPNIYFIRLPAGFLGYCGNFRGHRIYPTVEEAQVFWSKSIAESVAKSFAGSVVICRAIKPAGPYSIKTMDDEYYGNEKYQKENPSDFMCVSKSDAKTYDTVKEARIEMNRLAETYGYGFLDVVDIDTDEVIIRYE